MAGWEIICVRNVYSESLINSPAAAAAAAATAVGALSVFVNIYWYIEHHAPEMALSRPRDEKYDAYFHGWNTCQMTETV